MIYNFLKENGPIKKIDESFIKEKLGTFTGYYNDESVPAYYVGPPPPNNYAKAYLIAFITDDETKKVVDLIIDPEIETN